MMYLRFLISFLTGLLIGFVSHFSLGIAIAIAVAYGYFWLRFVKKYWAELNTQGLC